LGDSGVEVGKGTFEHPLMLRTLRAFEALDNTAAIQQQFIARVPLGQLLSCEGRFPLARMLLGFGLLFLDGLALPSSSHNQDCIVPNGIGVS
jgi:hypothetical protein